MKSALSAILIALVSSGKPLVQTDNSSIQCTSESNISFTISTPGQILHDNELDITVHAVGMMDQIFHLKGERKSTLSKTRHTFKMTEVVPASEGDEILNPQGPIKATLTIDFLEDPETETFTAQTGSITINGGKRHGVAQHRYSLVGCQGTFR